MLTEKEFQDSGDNLISELENAGLSAGIVYSATAGKNSLLEGVRSIVFKLSILENAMYPHLEAECANPNGEIIGRFGFTKTEYFTTVPTKNEKFGFNMMYDVSELKNLKDSLNLTINSEFYFSQKKQLEDVLNEINTIITSNNLKN